MAASSMKEHSPIFTQMAEEIIRIYKTLPSRPTAEEKEAAQAVMETVNSEERIKLANISEEVTDKDTLELSSLLKQIKKTFVLFGSHEEKKEARHMIENCKYFDKFDELIQRVAELINGEKHNERSERQSFLSRTKDSSEGLEMDYSSRESVLCSGGGEDREKIGLLKVSAIIETSAKNKERVLNLRGKLTDKVEWLPTSIAKLSHTYKLDLSENKIMALPITINSLTALTNLDLHSNQLINLPDIFGELVSLTHLNLSSNMLKSLPSSFTNLTNLIDLNLGSNYFTLLPDFIGNLVSLKILDAQTNELEELPYTIGSCTSIIELILDLNQIRALPEAIGKLSQLEILTLHYNKIGKLPMTMGNLSNLRELDVSFNELQAIPETLCFATNLKKLNFGKNFADLRALPRSIGNLEMLEELDISDNQIRALPDSFRFLSNLKVFRADETPLERPLKEVTKLGAQAVVQYITECVANKDLNSQQPKKKRSLPSKICSIFCG